MTANKITPQLPFSHSCPRRAFRRTSRTCFSTALAAAVIVLGGGVSSAQAQTAIGATWANTGSEWTNGASWLDGNAPTNSFTNVGNVATFSNAAVGNNTVSLGSAQGIYGVVLTTGANAYTFTGSALTVNNVGGISNASANAQTFSNKIVNNGGTAIYGSYSAGGSLVFAGGIDLTTSGSSASRTVTFLGSGGVTVSGAISAGGTSTGGNLIFGNAALNTLSGNNTYFGTTTVSNGSTLRLGSATALGATNGATEIKSGGALDLNGQTIGAEALTISGTGVSSSGVIFNSSASAASLSGNIAPTAGSTIKATNGSITLSGGIDLNNSAVSSRTITLDGTGGLIVSGNISNSFAGSTGTLVIAATASNVTLSGSNSYNGTTTLTGGGAMNINSANAISTNTFDIGSTTFLNNTSGGALTNLGNNSITLGSELTFGTAGSTAVNSLNLGTGTVTVSSSRTITIAGTSVTLGLGTLDSTSTGTARTFTANGASNTLSLAGWKIQSGSLSNVVAKLAGTANWVITGPIVNGNAFSNGVDIDAIGLTTFSGNNTYDGTTIISTNATLRITSATGLGSTNTGTTVDAGGQLQLSDGITVDGEALSLSGGTGSLATLRNISGNNTYNGAVTFSGGTNRIDSDAGTLTLSSFANTLSSSRSLFVGGVGNTVFTGRVTGTGSATLTKDGAGTLTLANTNNELGATGGVLINSGTLALGTNNALGATRAVAVNGGTLDIGAYDNTVGAVSLTNGTIAGSTGVLSGTNYAVQNGTISAILGGSGALTKSGSGTVTLSGANTYLGSTVINSGSLELGSSGSLRFFAGASGSNNAVSGAGAAVLGGTFNVDLSAASTNSGSSWALVSVASPSYVGSFNVAGFTNSGGIWSRGTNGVTYQFSQSTGLLSVASSAPVSAYNSWLTNYPSLANTNGDADPDGDGFDNNMEFAFDGNPTVGTAALLTATRSGSNAVFNFVASTNTNAVSYAVQSTTNLSTGPWDDDIGVTASVTNSANQTNPAILLVPDYVRREFSLPATNKSFYRVKATIAP
jgi:fibronectin-binding autotransporter adhesin